MGRALAVWLFLFSVLALGFLAVKDTDFGWHYRCGEMFLKQNKLCLNNDFSYFLSDYRSFYPSFLYDIVLAFIFDRLGFIGLSFLGSLVFTISAFLIVRLFSGFLWIKMLAFYLIFFLSLVVFDLGLRSQIVTYLFFILVLLLIDKAKTGEKKYLLFLPFIFLIWVNTHIGFFVGLILLLFFIISRRNRFTISILIISFFSTLINPFGIKVYVEIARHLSSPLNTMIAEWVAPGIEQKIIIISTTLFLLITFLKKRQVDLYFLAVLVCFAILALNTKRNEPFFYTVFFYVLFKQDIINALVKKLQFSLIANEIILPFLMAVFVLVLSLINLPQAIMFDRSWKEYCTKSLSIYPCQADKTISQLSGNVFAMYEWGGFLIWQYPKIKVFVDGRMPAWKDKNGKSPYEVFLEIIQARDNWNEKLAEYQTNYLLIQPGTFLDLLLQKEAPIYHWQEIYRDSLTVIYKKI